MKTHLRRIMIPEMLKNLIFLIIVCLGTVKTAGAHNFTYLAEVNINSSPETRISIPDSRPIDDQRLDNLINAFLSSFG